MSVAARGQEQNHSPTLSSCSFSSLLFLTWLFMKYLLDATACKSNCQAMTTHLIAISMFISCIKFFASSYFSRHPASEIAPIAAFNSPGNAYVAKLAMECCIG
jgi:hypothetical protein